MRTFKRLILLLLVLAIAGLIAVQWWVRSSGGISSFEQRIKASTGLEPKIGAVQLRWNLNVLATDLALILKNGENEDQVLFEAPAVTLSGHCRGRVIRVSRPAIKAVQSRRGEWVPSQLKDFVDSDAFLKSLLALSSLIDENFEITDAVFVMQGSDGREVVSYSGMNWYHAPAHLKGRLGLMHNIFSLQCVDGQPLPLAYEWLSDSRGTYFLSSSDDAVQADASLEETAEPSIPAEEELNAE